MLSRIRFVLVATTHPGNIGAAARAMHAMGLARLFLVSPRRFPDAEADALARSAVGLLERAVVTRTLDEALQGTVAAFGLTARRRDLSHPALPVREAAPAALAAAAQGEVAFVFGTEMSGLSNDELIRCGALVHIPTSPDFSSLNLAQAVQIVAYELWIAATGGGIPAGEAAPRASFEQVEHLLDHLRRVMIEVEFLDPERPRRLMERLRRLFARAVLEQEEVNVLRGILTAVERWGETLERRRGRG